MVDARSERRGSGPPLIGRDEVVEAAGRLLDRTRDRSGGGLLLVGPGGIGKSRMLRGVVDLAVGREFRVLTGRALPEELPAPFSLVRDLLRTAHPERARPERGGTDIVLPIFLAPLPESRSDSRRAEETGRDLGSGPEDLERILAPLGVTAIEGLGAGREEMLGQLGDYFRNLSRDGPLLLAADDLSFADPSSLEFLLRLARDLASSPIALVATVGVGAEVPPAARGAIAAIAAVPTVVQRTLRPFSVEEVTEFARWILGGRRPERTDVLRWHAQTEGNPLFVEQLVGAATGSGRPASGEASEGKDVREILLGRVRGLSESDRRLLTYAAALGKEFAFSYLAAVVGMAEEHVTEGLDRLVQVGLLREKGGEVYEFVVEGVRATIYAALTETRRRILHRKIGRALAAHGGASDVELARQFYLGREDDRAIEYNLRAAQLATRAFAFETAVAHLGRALEVERRRPNRDPRVEIRLLTEEGRLLDELGSLYRSEETLLEAVDRARARPGLDLELGRALLGLAQTRYDRSEYGSAETLANEAMALLEKVGSPRDLMAAHRVLGVVFWRRGDLPPAEAHQRAALEIAEREGTALEQGHALVDVANTMVPLGEARFEPALELYGRAADLFGTVEDHGARARVLMNQAVLEYGADRTDAAFRTIEVAIAAADRSRSPIWIGYCHLNLAQWHAELGRPERARPALERAVQALGPIGDRLGEQQIAMTRGLVAEAEGTLNDAETHYLDALARAREMRLGPEVSEMLFRLAGLSRRRGDLEEARDRLRDAEASGLLEHRPDFAARHATLAKALEGTG